MLPSKFEANPTLRLRVRRVSFASFPLASSCSNDYFLAYVIIDFLANRLVFLVTMIVLGQCLLVSGGPDFYFSFIYLFSTCYTRVCQSCLVM